MGALRASERRWARHEARSGDYSRTVCAGRRSVGVGRSFAPFCSAQCGCPTPSSSAFPSVRFFCCLPQQSPTNPTTAARGLTGGLPIGSVELERSIGALWRGSVSVGLLRNRATLSYSVVSLVSATEENSR
uniref:Uncharacterized protein n=1 Tax=Plectus sambesii TaxID=2011161 RepID=A0A914UJD5_9BILA